MGQAEPDFWKAKMQANHGVTIPVEVLDIWGLEKGQKATLCFVLDDQGRVFVAPAKQITLKNA